MGQGQVRCCGSSLFLKNRYGQGYHLTITKTPQCDQAALCTAITGAISGAKLITDVGTELQFQLPTSQSQNFAGLFQQFEGANNKYGVQEYGVSITTMEEIFIKVARGDGHEKASSKQTEASITDTMEEPKFELRGSNAVSQVRVHFPFSFGVGLSDICMV